VVYNDKGWVGFGDWLGTGSIKSSLRTYRPFNQAREWVQRLGLRGRREWLAFCAGRLEGKPPKPADIPSDPASVYKDEGWISIGDWLGTGTVALSLRTYRPFAEARAWARGLGLRGKREWQAYCAGRLEGKPPKPADVPSAAHLIYKGEGWKGIPDWLGTDRKQPRKRKKKPS
jgi:hypothetical protein